MTLQSSGQISLNEIHLESDGSRGIDTQDDGQDTVYTGVIENFDGDGDGSTDDLKLGHVEFNVFSTSAITIDAQISGSGAQNLDFDAYLTLFSIELTTEGYSNSHPASTKSDHVILAWNDGRSATDDNPRLVITLPPGRYLAVIGPKNYTTQWQHVYLGSPGNYNRIPPDALIGYRPNVSYASVGTGDGEWEITLSGTGLTAGTGVYEEEVSINDTDIRELAGGDQQSANSEIEFADFHGKYGWSHIIKRDPTEFWSANWAGWQRNVHGVNGEGLKIHSWHTPAVLETYDDVANNSLIPATFKDGMIDSIFPSVSSVSGGSAYFILNLTGVSSAPSDNVTKIIIENPSGSDWVLNAADASQTTSMFISSPTTNGNYNRPGRTYQWGPVSSGSLYNTIADIASSDILGAITQDSSGELQVNRIRIV